MKKFIGSILICIVATACGVSCIRAQNNTQIQQPPQTDIIARLQSLEGASTEEKIQILKEAEDHKNELLGVLENGVSSNDPQTVFFSMYLIGSYRLSGEADDLAARITYEDRNILNYNKHNIVWYWGRYPAVEALVHIGLPSAPFMVNNLATKTDKLTRELSLDVLLNLSGNEDTELARLYLQRALGKEKDIRKRKNLAAAIAALPQGSPQGD